MLNERYLNNLVEEYASLISQSKQPDKLIYNLLFFLDAKINLDIPPEDRANLIARIHSCYERYSPLLSEQGKQQTRTIMDKYVGGQKP